MIKTGIRTFDGKIFEFFAFAQTKREAVSLRKGRKRKGQQARITHLKKPVGQNNYAVWVNR